MLTHFIVLTNVTSLAFVGAEVEIRLGFLALVAASTLPIAASAQDRSRDVQPIDPGSWVTNDDYPPAAKRLRESGVAGFRLRVDETGGVSDCEVMSSSGSALLDITTCTLLRERAQFEPALDADGTPIPATFSSRFRWELEDDGVRPLASFGVTTRMVIGDGGEILSCSEHVVGSPEMPFTSCDQASSMFGAAERAMIRRDAPPGPVTIAMTILHRLESDTDFVPPAGSEDLPYVRSYTIAFTVGIEGTAFDCVASGEAGAPVGGSPASICGSAGPRYEIPLDDNGIPTKARVRVEMKMAASIPIGR